jgi:hypothetical protein
MKLATPLWHGRSDLNVGRLQSRLAATMQRGSADIEHDQESPLIDRIALYVAGIDAQELFEAPNA